MLPSESSNCSDEGRSSPRVCETSIQKDWWRRRDESDGLGQLRGASADLGGGGASADLGGGGASQLVQSSPQQ